MRSGGGRPRSRQQPEHIRHPRVPSGARILHEGPWFSTTHSAAYWYRVVAASPDWRYVRLEVATQPDAPPELLRVEVRAEGIIVPLGGALPGADAPRIIGTAIIAAQRAARG